MLKTGIMINQVTRFHISIQKQRHYWCLKHYNEIYQDFALELKTLDIIWQHRGNLCGLLDKEMGEAKVGQRHCHARAKRNAIEANF